MTAFATANRANLRRWAISAVIVMLVHGAIAAAVLTWRKTLMPAQFPGPVVIDLAPAPVAPATQQAALPPAPEQVPSAASPDRPLEKVEEKTEEKTAARGEEKARPKPVEELPGVTLAPSENSEGENRADTKAAPGGGAPVQAGGGNVNPIDTRIAEPPGPHSNKAAKANDWKKTIMAHPSKNSGERQQRRDSGAAGGMARNAIGMLMQDHTGAASTRGRNAVDGAKNAVGGAATNTVGATTTNGVPGTVTNAIGVAVAIRASAAGTNIGKPRIGPVASSVTTPPNAIINGTGMSRPGSGTGMIGGPAKNVAGVINGTGIRRK
jgi:hypothetical protein